jgi:hypothetical protein
MRGAFAKLAPSSRECERSFPREKSLIWHSPGSLSMRGSWRRLKPIAGAPSK